MATIIDDAGFDENDGGILDGNISLLEAFNFADSQAGEYNER